MYLLASAIFVTSAATAQGTRLGVDGGINMANLTSGYEGVNTSNQIKVGLNVGAFADIPLGAHLSVQPGLRYSLKGGKVEYSKTETGANSSYMQTENKLALHYAELPVNLVYTFGNEASRSKVFVGLGAYFAVLFDAEEKYKIKYRNGLGAPTMEYKGLTEDLKIGNNDGYNNIKRTDYGAQAFVGYKLNNSWFVKAGGQAGFEKLRTGSYRSTINGVTTTGKAYQENNYVFFLNIGYLFGNGGGKTQAN
jgi:hypothetical protein